MTSKISVKRWGQGMDPMEIVTRAAWCSYDNDQREYTKEQGERLCAYLFKCKHWTPFAQFGWVRGLDYDCDQHLCDLILDGKISGFQRLGKRGFWFGSAWAWHEFDHEALETYRDIFEADTGVRLEGDDERINLAFDMPIFVARQIMRSNIGIVWNEMSRRYVSSDPDLWWPRNNGLQWRKAPKKGQSKQGSSGDFGDQIGVQRHAVEATNPALNDYGRKTNVNNAAPEQARMILPQNTMTRVCGYASRKRWKQLAALRSQPDAQAETRLIAEQILDAVA